MKPFDYPKMIFSYHTGWDELRGIHPSIGKVSVGMVLPLSLLPALMIALAGYLHGNYYEPGVSLQRWYDVAGLFFLAELATVPLMAWVIHLIAKEKGHPIHFHDSYLLAAVTPIPLWLSALSLLLPNLQFNAAIGLLGLVASGSLLYHGVSTILGIKEALDVQDVTYKVFAVGAIAWGVLVALVVLPTIGV
ncbi:MAG TPA: YIP1 family protein [Gallionellaceae bacterium]|nr:YIP1 family protein [Gallionellaceae bacterium]